MDAMKKHLPLIIALVALIVLVACTCRVTFIPDPPKDLVQLTVAQKYVLDNWESKMLPSIRSQARDITELLPIITSDLTGAAAEYAKRENETSAFNFCLKGNAKVLEVEFPEKASKTRLLLDISPYDGVADCKIQVSSVIKTNALRDAVGFLKLDNFANQVEFASLTTEFNNRIKEDVIANLDISDIAGKEIYFEGAVAITQTKTADDLLIVPIHIELKAGEV